MLTINLSFVSVEQDSFRQPVRVRTGLEIRKIQTTTFQDLLGIVLKKCLFWWIIPWELKVKSYFYLLYINLFHWNNKKCCVLLEGDNVLDVTPPMPLLEPERIAEDFLENSPNKFVKLRMKSGAKLSVKLKAKNEKNDLKIVRFNNKKDKRILSDFELEIRSKRNKNKCTKYPKSKRNPTRFYKICSEQ